MSNAGYATLQIIPSADGFLAKLQSQLGTTLPTAGTKAGKDMGEGVKGGLSNSLKGVGALLGGTVLLGAVTSFVSSALDAFGGFERALNQVAAATKAPQVEMDKLNKLALDLGASTKFSAGEAADAMLALAKGGFSPAQIQAGALASTLDLAAAGGLGLSDAANVMTAAMNTFGISAQESTRIANALAGSANASAADVSDMALALSQAGSQAKLSGLSLEETAAALAIFANNGVRGSDAGTSLKTMLMRLVPSTDKAADAMKALGLDFTNADGSFVSLADMAGRLQASLGGLSEEQRTLALNTIFGSDASRAAAFLMSAGRTQVEAMTAAAMDQTAAQNMADASMKGWAGTVEKLSGAWESFKIQFGQFVAPAITPILEGMAKAMEFVTNHSDIMMPVLVGVVAILGTLGVIAVVAGAALLFMAAAEAAVLWPIVLIVAGLIALVAVIIVVWKYHKQIGAFFVKVWDAIKTGVTVAIDAIGSALTAVGRFFTNTIPAAAATALAWFAALPGKIWAFIQTIPALMLEGLKQTAFAVGFGIGLIVGLIINLPGMVTNLLVSMWFKAVELTTAGANAVAAWFADMAARAVAFLAALPGRVWDLLTSLWARAITIVAQGTAATLKFFQELPGNAVAFLSQLPGKVQAIAGNAINWLRQAGIDAVQGLINGITSMVGKLANLVGDLAGKVSGGFKAALKIFSPSRVFRGFGENIVQGLVVGIGQQTGSAVKAVRNLAAGVADVPFGLQASGASASASAAPGAGGISIGTVEVRAYSDRFSTKQVIDDLALHGAH